MPPAHRYDPRTYIRSVPLPIPTQKGIPIQARSATVFNPTLPTREDVRQSNYRRRQQQMLAQGFRSLNYKPYKGVGDPFYLDQRRLILHALGQLDDSEDYDSSSSSDSDDEDYRNVFALQQRPMTAAKFVLRRSRKDLNTLPKEVNHGRSMMRNVRLGHGLFHLLRSEKQAKSNATLLAERKQRLQNRNEWQPAKTRNDSSDEDTTDEELAEDVDLHNYMTESMVVEGSEVKGSEVKGAEVATPLTSYTETSRSRVAFHGAEGGQLIPELPKSAGTARTGSGRLPRPGSRKRLPSARPYTPQHSNIATESSRDWADKEALFRQLCALHWLLEAMNPDQSTPTTMVPITTCWHFKEMGGSRPKPGSKEQREQLVQKEKNEDAEKRWRQFLTNQSYRDGPLSPHRAVLRRQPSFNTGQLSSSKESVNFSNKRTSLSRHSKTPRRYSVYPRGSVSATVTSGPSPAGSQSQLNVGGAAGLQNVRLGSTIPEDSEANSTHPEATCSTVTDEEEEIFAKGLFKYLDEFYESMKREEEGEASDKASSPGGATTEEVAPPSGHRMRRHAAEIEHHHRRMSAPARKSTDASRHSDEPSRLHPERRSSRSLRADTLIRPKSCSAVLEYQAHAPSTEHTNLILEMRQKFAEISEEKALDLHDTLEGIERYRFKKLQNKFVHMPVGGSFYRAVAEMRRKSVSEEDKKAERRLSMVYQQWFSNLLHHIPDEARAEWYFVKILDKLSRYGLVEASKQSTYKFLKVLTGLRDWEICSPDISAAVEFCRQEIVEMSVEEFEDWFQQQFPLVRRPQTAPPGVKSGKTRSESGTQRQGKGAVPRSAPPGVRKRN